MILSQDTGDVVVSEPSFYIDECGIFQMDLFRFMEKSGKSSASGFGTYPIQIKLSNYFEEESYSIKSISIYNSHLELWKTYFERILAEHMSQTGHSISTNVDDGGKEFIYILFDVDEDSNSETYCPIASLKVSDFEVQISPGWVE